MQFLFINIFFIFFFYFHGPEAACDGSSRQLPQTGGCLGGSFRVARHERSIDSKLPYFIYFRHADFFVLP